LPHTRGDTSTQLGICGPELLESLQSEQKLFCLAHLVSGVRLGTFRSRFSRAPHWTFNGVRVKVDLACDIRTLALVDVLA